MLAIEEIMIRQRDTKIMKKNSLPRFTRYRLCKMRFFSFRVFSLILTLIGCSFTSQQALALSCVNNADNSTSFAESIASSIAVPQSVPDNTIIWRSEMRTMQVRCFLATSGNAEYVNAYFNPKKVSLPGGVVFGVNFNGVDVNSSNSSSSKGVSIGILIPTCTGGANCPTNPTIFTAQYYVYAKKLGTGNSGSYTGSNFAVFQLDGAGGMNGTPNSNFVYTVNNLSNIRFISCNATAAVSPNTVNFGYIPAYKPTIGQLAKEQNFTITVSKTCDDPVKVSTTYSSTQTVINGNGLDLKNGLTLMIKNLNGGNFITYTNTEVLADLSATRSVIVPFLAQLVWNKTVAVTGSMNAAVTFTFTYN